MGDRECVDADIDACLVVARRGDQQGFTGIYRLLAGRVAGYVRGRGVLEVDDVTNDVFLGAFQNLDTFNGQASEFRSWLFSIAWNKSVDWHRSSPRRPMPVDVSSTAAQAQAIDRSTDEQLDHVLADERVDVLLAALTPDQRDVLMMRIVADLSLEETAAALRKPTGAVKSLQHRALESLRRKINAPVSDIDSPTIAGVT